jgi:hypothetical protein
MEHFYRKKVFTEADISQNVHLGISSNFAKINFNIWTKSYISKTRGILLRFKMAAGLKMVDKKWFFDHNSVNIKYFCDLFFISPSMPLTGLSLEMYIFHFEAISLSTHISGSKRPIFTILVLFERCQ